MKDSPVDAPVTGVLRNFVTISAGLTSIFLVQAMLLLAIPLWALELGANASVLGLLLSLPYILPLIFAIPLGAFITKVGAQKIIIFGSIGMAISPWCVLHFEGYAGLILAQLLIGFSNIIMVIAAQSVIGSLGRGRALENYFGWHTTFLSGGQLIGPLLVGWIIDHYEIRLAFLVMGFIPLIAFFSAFLLTGSAKVGKRTDKAVSGYRMQAKLLKENRAVQISLALTVTVVFALGTHASFLPVYLESIAISATAIGMLASLRAFSSMIIRPFMPITIKTLGGRKNAMVASAIAVTLGITWTGTTSSIFILAIFSILIGIGSGISQPLSMVVIAEHVSIEQRSSALGMRLMGNRGAQLFAPLFLGFLVELVGFTLTFFIAGLLLSVLVFLLTKLDPGDRSVNTISP